MWSNGAMRSFAALAAVFILLSAPPASSRSLSAQVTSIVSVSTSNGGTARSSSRCVATDGNTANCISTAISNGGDAVAEVVGEATQGDVTVEATALNLGSKDVEVVARALVEGAGDATSVAIADKVTSGGEEGELVVAAISKVIAEEGCEKVKPALASAFAIAQGNGHVRDFADAFDVDVQISECLYPTCEDDRWHCCEDDTQEKCTNNLEVTYSVFKTTPRHIYGCETCEVTHCLCNN